MGKDEQHKFWRTVFSETSQPMMQHSMPLHIILIPIICNSLISIIFGIIVLNWTYLFYKLSKHGVHCLLVRRPKSVILFGICLMVGLLLRLPTLASFMNNNIGYFNGSKAIAHFLLHCTSIAVPYILLFRTYLVFYDIKFCQALQDQKCMYIYTLNKVV